MKKTFIVSIVVSLVLMLIPVFFYLWYFRNSMITPDPQAWGSLGDYFGGLLNPIISVANLFVLGYLTYLIALQTARDSKNLFILERRMLAYDELAKFIKPINSFTAKMNSIMSLIPKYEQLPPIEGAQRMVRVYEDLRDLSFVFSEFYFALHEFNPRYGHLFKYNFNSTEYKDLLAESKRVSTLMTTLVGDHQAVARLPSEQRDLEKFANLLFPVFVALRSEVETKPAD